MRLKKILECHCFSNSTKNKKNIELFYDYHSPPPLEPIYKIKNYKRKIMRCKICGHFTAKHEIKVSEFYKKNYSLISHGDDMKKKFNKINNLKSRSDNFHRVERILSYFKDFKKKEIDLLDVGSGLSIFLYQLKKKVNWKLVGVEPDINFVNFAKKLNINVVHSNLKSNIFKNNKFNIITMNKIIEHVKDPVKLLKISKKLLIKNGYVYIEVPDGFAASRHQEGKFREEFFVDHLHVFSKKSLIRSIKLAGLSLLFCKSIKEKSGKLSLYAFAKKII
jgi:2-polyprenyl-3-methyl-5-hydroxy-6-metoxy-1,4-benzoquinol methylase